jgi:hypothetical protein
MKLFGYLLAFYIITLSAVPCCSFDNCSEDKTEQNSNHKQGDDDCGNCSPFFTCAGCTGFAFTIEPLLIQSSSSISSKIFTGYIESSTPDIYYDFWQPPKIA